MHLVDQASLPRIPHEPIVNYHPAALEAFTRVEFEPSDARSRSLSPEQTGMGG